MPAWVVPFFIAMEFINFWRSFEFLFKDNTLLQDAYKCSNGDAIDFNDYGNEEHDLALCWTNQAVDAVNKKWNKHYANGKQVEVNGFKQSKFYK